MPTDQSNPTERLIAEPLCVRLGIDRTPVQAVASGNNVAALGPRATSLTPEANRIVDALRAICASPEDTIVMWCGRPHKIVRPHHANPAKGTQLIGRPGAERAAQIVLAPDDEKKQNQHIFTKFAVVPNGKPAPGKPPFFLECEGNPLMTGNNVLPVTSRNPKTKAVERYPSSAHKVMTTLNRLLFRFLEDIAAQITGSDAGLFEPETRRAIESGDFAIVHIQWCCYLQADVSRFLQVLSALFYPRGATEVGFSSLAGQMGLRFDDEIDERTTRVTAVKFEKRHGKNSAFSVTFYNKRTRVGQMRQGKTLDPDEEELIDNNVRFDMTAHAIGIMRIIEAARSFLREHRELFTQLPETQRSNDFLSKNPQPTARWLEFAVFILSHRLVQGTMRRGSFADYLAPLFLDDVLNLRSIVCCSAEGLRALETLKHPVAKAWREDKSYETRGWAMRLANAADYRSDTVVYQCQDEWLTTYGVNIAKSLAIMTP